FGAEQRRAGGVPTHGDDQALEKLRGALDEVDVPVRRRVEAARVDGDEHAAHCAAPPAGVAFDSFVGAGAVAGALALPSAAPAGLAAAGAGVAAAAGVGAAGAGTGARSERG